MRTSRAGELGREAGVEWGYELTSEIAWRANRKLLRQVLERNLERSQQDMFVFQVNSGRNSSYKAVTRIWRMYHTVYRWIRLTECLAKRCRNDYSKNQGRWQVWGGCCKTPAILRFWRFRSTYKTAIITGHMWCYMYTYMYLGVGDFNSKPTSLYMYRVV